MKTKLLFKEFQIHNVPFESIYFNKKEQYILLDDAEEKRWKFTIIDMVAFRQINIDYVKNEEDYFDKECFIQEEPFPLFRRYILEENNSDWIKQIKSNLNRNISTQISMDNIRHFVLPLYDNRIEFIAQDIFLEPFAENKK